MFCRHISVSVQEFQYFSEYMNVRFLILAGLLIILAGFSFVSDAGELKQVVVEYDGKPKIVTYEYYVPSLANEEHLPVLICTGGLPMDGDQYLRSDTHECFNERWKKFADENRMVIVGLGFLFEPEDWLGKTSYQYAQVWSGKALLAILAELSREVAIDDNQLYLFGISAGAQFSIRFAQMESHRVKAVASHAAGGYDQPQKYIPTSFLLTVGKSDNKEISRLDMAREFMRLCKARRINIRLKVIPGIAHRQTEQQNEMSRDFIAKVLKESQRS